MRTLNTYILRNFLVTLGMGLGIMTFVLLSGNLCKSDVINMFISVVSPMVLLKFSATCSHMRSATRCRWQSSSPRYWFSVGSRRTTRLSR